MVKTSEHDPLALFGFALRESDWILADLLACLLAADEGTRERLHRELERGARRPGRPASLPELHRWARLSRDLGLTERNG